MEIIGQTAHPILTPNIRIQLLPNGRQLHHTMALRTPVHLSTNPEGDGVVNSSNIRASKGMYCSRTLISHADILKV